MYLCISVKKGGKDREKLLNTSEIVLGFPMFFPFLKAFGNFPLFFP